MKPLIRGVWVAIAAWSVGMPLRAEVRTADPATYRALLRQLKPGDTLNLAPGRYPRLPLENLNGTRDAWITIISPASDPPAVIEGSENSNTVEIVNCSYLSLENLRIDSRGIPGAFGLSAKGGAGNRTHHIRIQGNTFVGQNGGQQTVAISTKTPTWGWAIRYNKILGAGTGMYFGNSDGTEPFVDGVIENNFIQDTIGYNLEIKDQVEIPAVPGMPLDPTSTIIRNNVFIKNDQPSPDGDRPNVLVGAFPENGPGSFNMYEIYGNLFVHNPREALFQGSGQLSLHDNIFMDGCPRYPAVMLAKHNFPLQAALVYNNTVYTSGQGIRFESPALKYDAVAGNLVFAARNPISGPIKLLWENLTGSVESAGNFVLVPSFDPRKANFYPLPGKCQGDPIDLTIFQPGADYTLDFNGRSKIQAKGAVVFRGAYAGEGQNPGWQFQAGPKAPNPPLPKIPQLVWISPASGQPGTEIKVTLTGANFRSNTAVTIGGEGVQVAKSTVDSETEITATLTVAPGAAVGARGITVSTSMGSSNALMFRLAAGNRRP
jgi:hypothetical protein